MIMDPLSAFGLACGVIQVLDFSRKVLVKCRELYKHGASSENEEIESMAKCLTGLSTDLDLANSVRNSGRTTQLYHDDQELLKLAQQCSRTATELVAKLQKLSIQDRFRKRDAVRKAVNGVWKKSTIEGIERRLEQYRRTLDTRILISLRFVQLRFATRPAILTGNTPSQATCPSHFQRTEQRLWRSRSQTTKSHYRRR